MQTTHQEQPYDVVSLAPRSEAANHDRQTGAADGGLTRVNVHGVERIASTLLGGYLLARWKLKSKQTSRLLAMVGSGLLYRGLSGHCHLYDIFGISTADSKRLA